MKDLDELVQYPYRGHSVTIGKMKKSWQDKEGVLGMFDMAGATARLWYGDE